MLRRCRHRLREVILTSVYPPAIPKGMAFFRRKSAKALWRLFALSHCQLENELTPPPSCKDSFPQAENAPPRRQSPRRRLQSEGLQAFRHFPRIPCQSTYFPSSWHAKGALPFSRAPVRLAITCAPRRWCAAARAPCGCQACPRRFPKGDRKALWSPSQRRNTLHYSFFARKRSSAVQQSPCKVGNYLRAT